MALPYMPHDENDALLTFISNIFGQVVRHIAGISSFDQWQTQGLIAVIIQHFNVFIWVISAIILSVLIIVQVGKHGHNIEHHKKDFLSEPIKTIAGIFLLMPTAFGYNIISLIILVCSLWGIQGANTIYKEAIKHELSQAMYFDSNSFLQQSLNLDDFAMNILASNYCAAVLNTNYSQAYGMGDNQYANIQMSLTDAYSSTSDISGKYYYTVPYIDNGAAKLGGGKSICGQMSYIKYDSKNLHSQAGNAAEFVQGGLLGVEDREFNQKFKELSQELQNEAMQIWYKQAGELIKDINQFIQENLPLQVQDAEKYQKLKEIIKSQAINEIIQKHKQQLVSELSYLSRSDGGFMGRLHKLYIKKIKSGGIINAIGYRQHIGQVRKYLYQTLSQTYVEAQHMLETQYLADDAVKYQALSLYKGVMQDMNFMYMLNKAPQNCENNLEQIIQQSQQKQSLSQLTNEYKRIQVSQIAAILNLLLGRADQCSPSLQAEGQIENNQSEQGQMHILERLQNAGALLSTIAVNAEQSLSKLNQQLLEQKKQNNITNLANGNQQQIEQQVELSKKIEQNISLLKSSAIWLNSVLPSILDFYLILALVLFPSKIISEMVAGSVSAMTLFIPNSKNYQAYAKQLLGLILYLPAVIIGYFGANVILNYSLEFGIGLSFSSMLANLQNGDHSIDLEQFKTMLMIFITIGGAITAMAGALILGIPMAVNKVLSMNDNDLGHTNAGQKVDTNFGIATHAGTSQTAYINNAGRMQRAMDGFDMGGINNANNNQDIKNKNNAPVQVVSHGGEGMPDSNIHVDDRSGLDTTKGK